MIKFKRLFVDQYGNMFYTSTIKELRNEIPGRCQRMFNNDDEGNLYHTGYVIGQHWLHEYTAKIRPA